MSANVNGIVKEAIRSYRSGNKDEARELLLRATELDEQNEQAWMWLSAVVESVEDQMVCLENVLVINPENGDAQRGLAMLKAKKAKENVTESSANVFEGVDASEWGDIDSDTADFLSDLGAGEDEDDYAYDDQDDEDDYNDDDEEDEADAFTSEYQSGYESDFEDAIFDSDYEDDFDDFDDDPFGEKDIVVDEGMDDEATLVGEPPAASDDSFFDDDFDLDTGPFAGSAAPSAASATSKSRKKRRGNAKSPDADLDADIFGGGSSSASDDDDLDIYFAALPDDIQPTRVPGMDEEYPRVLLPAVALLAVGNLIALVLLVI